MSITEAIATLKGGGMIVLVDAEGREDEGDLVCAAQTATAEQIHFMIRHGGGLITVPLPASRCDALALPLMVPDEQNTEVTQCRFTVSVDAKKGTETGISAQDRALTIKALVDPATTPDDLARPGHIFPLRADPGGLAARDGHTEAGLELCARAGQSRGAVLCEVLDGQGRSMRRDELARFAEKHQLPLVHITELL